MAYVDGGTLGDRIRERGPVSNSEAVRLLREVSWALGHAHLQGVVHRDVKPDNILLDQESGRAMVTDFGIAVVAERLARFVPPPRVHRHRYHGVLAPNAIHPDTC